MVLVRLYDFYSLVVKNRKLTRSFGFFTIREKRSYALTNHGNEEERALKNDDF